MRAGEQQNERHGVAVPFSNPLVRCAYCEVDVWLGIWFSATFFGVER